MESEDFADTYLTQRGTLINTTTQGQIGPVTNPKEGILCTHQISRNRVSAQDSVNPAHYFISEEGVYLSEEDTVCMF